MLGCLAHLLCMYNLYSPNEITCYYPSKKTNIYLLLSSGPQGTPESSTLVMANDGDDCDPNPCGNGGTCIDLKSRYVCLCKPGYTGPTCDDGKIYVIPSLL